MAISQLTARTKQNIAGFISVLLLATFSLWGVGLAEAQLKTTFPQKLNLIAGKSTVIETLGPIKRVSLADPEVADAMVLTARQIYITGKSPGVTNLTLWEDGKISAVFDIEVSADISRLKEELHKILPEEKDIRVTATNDSIALSGTVSSTAIISKVLALAEPYAPGKGKEKGRIINLMEVGGVHQVMLEVRVAEMSRSLTKRLGFNFNYISSSGRNLGLSLLNRLTNLPEDGWPSNAIEVSDSVNAAFSFTSNDTSWTVFIDALKENGLVRVLAEPTLITLSGQTANFLAGGEFPIPVPDDDGLTIEYKEFGVGLSFTPTVLSSGKINMQVAPEVSELDFANAVLLTGFVVPGLTTRRISTMVELGDGQSFAIAGLLQDNVREIVSKFPVLGDIPILGSLFRSSSFKKNETELIVIVTPHLVKPLDLAKQTLPTDQYIEPDDFEFYMLGILEGREKEGMPVTSSRIRTMKKEGGLEGDFGHIMPK